MPKFSAGAELKDVVSGAKKLPKLTRSDGRRRRPARPRRPPRRRRRRRRRRRPRRPPPRRRRPKTAAKKAAGQEGPGQEGAGQEDGCQEGGTAKKAAAKKAPAKKTTAKKTAAKKARGQEDHGDETAAKKAPAKKTHDEEDAPRRPDPPRSDRAALRARDGPVRRAGGSGQGEDLQAVDAPVARPRRWSSMRTRCPGRSSRSPVPCERARPANGQLDAVVEQHGALARAVVEAGDRGLHAASLGQPGRGVDAVHVDQRVREPTPSASAPQVGRGRPRRGATWVRRARRSRGPGRRGARRASRGRSAGRNVSGRGAATAVVPTPVGVRDERHPLARRRGRAPRPGRRAAAPAGPRRARRAAARGHGGAARRRPARSERVEVVGGAVGDHLGAEVGAARGRGRGRRSPPAPRRPPCRTPVRPRRCRRRKRPRARGVRRRRAGRAGTSPPRAASPAPARRTGR